MPHAGAQPRPYALVGAGLVLAAGALAGLGRGGLAVALVVAAMMLFAQSALLHLSATSGRPRELERLRASLLVGEDERLVELHPPLRGALPERDASIDAVLGIGVLSSLPDAGAREAACRELLRILRPGGRLALLEARGTHDVALALEDLGLEAVERSGLRWAVWPPARTLTGRRPAA